MRVGEGGNETQKKTNKRRVIALVKTYDMESKTRLLANTRISLSQLMT